MSASAVMGPKRWLAIVLLWAGAAGCGIWAMLEYEYTPAAVEPSPPQWPAASAVVPGDRRPTLLMFVHPHCPCSRASLAELSELAARYRGQIDIRVVFVRPAGFPAEWVETDLWRTAASTSGVDLFRDDEGVEAARFHASASGETLLFDAAGRLMFQGGLTPSRGHRGDSAGRSAIEAALRGATSTRLVESQASDQHTPVFGCCLSDRCKLPETSSTAARPSAVNSASPPSKTP